MHTCRAQRSAVLAACLLLLQAGLGAAQAAPVDPLVRPSTANVRLATALMLSVAPAGKRLVAVGERGFIQFSDDNGATWTQVGSPVSLTLTAVRFVDALHGWAVGHAGVVLATSDAGKTWRKQLDGTAVAALMKAAALSYSGSAREAALREAEQLAEEGADKPFFDVYFSDTNVGVIVGAYGLAFSTEDGGRSWKPLGARLPNPDGSHLFKLYADSAGLWIVGERGLVMRGSSLLGQFTPAKQPYGGSLYGAACTPERTCYVYGLRGSLLRFDSDSDAWTMVGNDQPLTITASVQAPGSMKGLFLADQGGRILRIDRQTSRLIAMSAKPLPPINALAAAADGALVAATVKGMVRVAPGDLR